MADKTTTTIIALAALTAGAIGGSTLIPSADAADTVDLAECASVTADGDDCTVVAKSLLVREAKKRAHIKRAKVIGVLDWIRVNKPAVWAQIMTVVQANWNNAYPPPEPEE